MPDVTILRPLFTTHNAIQIAHDLYNLSAAVRQLPSERDQNFHLTTSDGEQFILKISGLTESIETLELENEILAHLSLQSPISSLIPKIIPSHKTQPISYAIANGKQYPVRLITHLPGVLLADSKPHSSQMLKKLAQISPILAEARFHYACGWEPVAKPSRSKAEILALRQKHFWSHR